MGCSAEERAYESYFERLENRIAYLEKFAESTFEILDKIDSYLIEVHESNYISHEIKQLREMRLKWSRQ